MCVKMDLDSAIPISNISIKEQMKSDLLEYYKKILIKHLDDRVIKEDKIKSWMNNILIEAQEYFINKYPNYDLFLNIYVCPLNVYFRANCSSISIIKTDLAYSVSFKTDQYIV